MATCYWTATGTWTTADISDTNVSWGYGDSDNYIVVVKVRDIKAPKGVATVRRWVADAPHDPPVPAYRPWDGDLASAKRRDRRRQSPVHPPTHYGGGRLPGASRRPFALLAA